VARVAGGMLVFGPTASSYKRYRNAGQFEPSQINWGPDNKTRSVKASAVRRA
jgi:glutamine synthetase